jgi:hypothetical protein
LTTTSTPQTSPSPSTASVSPDWQGVRVIPTEGVSKIECSVHGDIGFLVHLGDAAAAANNHYQVHITLDGWKRQE